MAAPSVEHEREGAVEVPPTERGDGDAGHHAEHERRHRPTGGADGQAQDEHIGQRDHTIEPDPRSEPDRDHGAPTREEQADRQRGDDAVGALECRGGTENHAVHDGGPPERVDDRGDGGLDLRGDVEVAGRLVDAAEGKCPKCGHHVDRARDGRGGARTRAELVRARRTGGRRVQNRLPVLGHGFLAGPAAGGGGTQGCPARANPAEIWHSTGEGARFHTICCTARPCAG